LYLERGCNVHDMGWSRISRLKIGVGRIDLLSGGMILCRPRKNLGKANLSQRFAVRKVPEKITNENRKKILTERTETEQ
jgi:hypothetical protein